MKKYVLLGIGLICMINSYGQKKENLRDEFTYKKINVTDISKGILPVTGSFDSNDENNKVNYSTGIGETQGDLSVSLTGGAVYDIPIAVPLGINGVTPQISLTYNSQNGNGLAGYGWNISGVSVISRIPSSKFHDNNIDAVDFDNLDRFALDGERLVLKSGTYGASGARYETENFSTLKIISYGTSSYGYGPSYFIVYYPDGSLAHYGHSNDSKSHTDYAVTYWQNPQGVRISYQYSNNNNNLSITSIKYGNRLMSNPINEIQFIYKYRHRGEQANINNVVFERTQILESIKVLAGGQGYKNYYLNHDRTNLQYERLISFQEKSGNNSLSHSPIIFNYSNTSSSVNYTGITTDIGLGNIEQRNAETVSLDITGNGKMDFIVYPKITSQKNKFWVFKDIQNGSFNYPIQVNSGSFESLFPVTWLTHNNKILSGQGIAIVQKTTNNKIKFKVYSNGTAAPIYYQYERLWNAPTYNTTPFCGATPITRRVPQKYISGDFNGDGLSDIITISQSYSYTICRSIPCNGGGGPFSKKQSPKNNEVNSDKQSNKFIPIGNCCDCNTVSSNYSQVNFINLDRRITSNFVKFAGNFSQILKSTDKLLTADVNGDGKTDILHVTDGKIYVYTLNNNNNLELLWQTSSTWIKTDFPLLLGDYNGDGKIDFMTPTTNNSHFFLTFLSTGTQFLYAGSNSFPFTYKQSEWNGSSATLHGYNLVPIDINGDGKTDIIDYSTTTYNNSANGSQTIEIYHNTGMQPSFSALPSPYFVSGGSTTKTGNLKHFPIPIFLTSDKPNKNLDFASISNNWITSFTFSKDHREDVLLRSIDNNGVNYSINYNNLNSSEYGSDYMQVYQAAYSQTYPNIDLEVTLGTKVVTTLQRLSSGVPTLKQIYSYYGAVINADGLGFLGFKGIAKSNWHTNNSDRIFNVTKYDPQLRGAITDEYTLPYSFNFTNIPSDYITKISYINSSSLAPNKVFKLWNSSSVAQNRLEGTVINKSFLYDTYNNPTKIITNYSGQGSRVIDITYANNIGSTYYIGKLINEKETVSVGNNTFSTEKQYSYSGYLLTQKKTKGNGTQFDTESYTYDVFGNITKKITIPHNTAGREVRYEYDTSGRYLIKSYDAEGLKTTYQYNTNLGTLTKETNPYGQNTKYFYDAWYRLIKATDYLGKDITTSYVESNNSYTITTLGDDGSGSITIYDPLKRITTVKEKNVLGQWVSKSYQYDKFDRVSAESESYTGSGPSQWNTTEYDFYGRLKSTTTYTGKVTNYTYNNLSLTVNDGTKMVTTTKNTMGNIVRVTDPGGTINYTYYGNGAMKTANYGGVVISTEQDGWGRKTKITDPSAGIYTYTYNGFDQVTKETTPKGSTNYTYSSIGKLLQKKIIGDFTNMTLQYTYHTTNKKINSISLISADGNNSTYSYTYDNYQRLKYTAETNPYAQFTKRYNYDSFGRIVTEESYGRLLENNKSSIKKIKNIYQNGQLKTIRDNATQEILWNIDAINARGQVTSITMGNNLRKKFTYTPLGFLTESKSEKNINTTPTQLMKLTFDFDTQRGTLNDRTNSLFSWTENFTYDNMDRLISFNDNNGNKNHSYDAKGRISTNSNIGTYNYVGNSYTLENVDLNYLGQQSYKSATTQQDISYNAFKKPVEIYQISKEKISFQYNGFMKRANMFYGDTQNDKLLRRYRKHYSFDGSMEISYDRNTGKTTFVTYIGGDGYSAPAIWRSEQGATITNGYYFLHRDYLGSILMISDINGIIKEKRHFDAWGNIVKLTDGNNTALEKFAFLDRGYTGHEHLQGVGLVHMNGRLYNPLLHRFLAPDNYIQNPYDTQNYNRYGYVLNNPLLYTDPSGEKGEGGFFNVPLIGWVAYGLFQLGKAIFGSNNSPEQSTPATEDLDLGTSSNNSIASTASVPPIPGSGYRLENPYGIWQVNLQSYISGVKSGYSQFWSGLGNEFKEAWRDPWGKWKQNTIERGGWKNIIPGYAAYQMTVGTQVHNYQTASGLISNLYNGNYYEAGEISGYAQGEGHLQLGIMAVTAGIAKGVPMVRGVFSRGTILAESGTFSEGSFSINDWAGYPEGKIKPNGPFRLLEGVEYDSARKLANSTNAALRRANPNLYKGLQIHEIHPVKFNGSPVQLSNKVFLTPAEHARYTTFWNRMMRNINKLP